MNDHDFDLATRGWLEDGPTRMSDRAVLATLEEIHLTRQRRAPLRTWSGVSLNGLAGLAAAATIVVATAFLAVNVLPLRGPIVGGPSPLATAPVDFPEFAATFVSPRNGFSIRHPERAAVTPATQLLGFGAQADDGFDLVETGLAAVFSGASTGSGFGGEGSIDDRVDTYLATEPVLPDGCGVPRATQEAIVIDGQTGRVTQCSRRIEATVVADDRLYLFVLRHDREDAKAVFDAFAQTIDLTPDTAVDVPGLTTTFVSPTYGYAFRYIDRGGLVPATKPWDPANQRIDVDFDERFDGVETGLGAYLEGASTPIPDGVALDAWVDEHIAPLAAGGCGVPRIEQDEIEIDGQTGRVVACVNGIQATVAAGGRLYLFILSSERSDARALFDTWVETIELRPDDVPLP